MRQRSVTIVPLLFLVYASALSAQATTAATALYAEPGVREIATIAKGVAVTAGPTAGQYVRITVAGFIANSLLGPARDSFPASTKREGARLRVSASASAAVVAELRQGMGLSLVRKQGEWSSVRRAGWVKRSALSDAKGPKPTVSITAKETPPKLVPVAPVKAAAQVAAPTPAAPVSNPTRVLAANPDLLTPVGTGRLSTAPDLPAIGSIQHGAALTVLAREHGWVRVRLEGWMRDQDLTAADSSLVQLSAADLRANPDGYKGRLVRWTVQVLAFQTADPLRRDMSPDEPYLLARGPGAEGALLYLAVPPSLLDRAKAIIPLTNALIMARVRTGKGDPSGVPILDLMSLTKN